MLPLLIAGIAIGVFVLVLFILGTLFVFWNPYPTAIIITVPLAVFIYAKYGRKKN